MVPVLKVAERTVGTRAQLNELRNKGLIPGVVYGKNFPTTHVSVDQIDLLKQVREHGRNSLYAIELQGKQQKVLVRDVQRDNLTNHILHVDLMAVEENTEIEATVNVTLVGEAEGARDGGVLQQLMYEMNITAKAEEIPESIEIDITDLQIGDAITIEQLAARYPFTINHPETDAVVTILPPKQEENIDTGEEQEPGIPDNPEEPEE